MKKLYFTLFISLMYLHNAYTQLYNNGANLVLTTGSYIVLQDINFLNNGIFIQSAGTVKITGGNNTSIAGTVKPQFFALEIAKSAGIEVQLLTDFNVSSEISFTSGLINLNNKNIFLNSTAILKNEAETRRIIGPNGGYVELTTILNAPSAANPGNLGAIISSTKNMGSTIIRRGHQSQMIVGGNRKSLLRYYDITPANNLALNATLRFQYFDAELNGLTENKLVLFKNIYQILWINQGFSSRSASTNYVIKNGIANFSRLTISSPVNVIPIRLQLPFAGKSVNPNSTINKTGVAKVFIENLYPTIGIMQSIYIKVGNENLQTMQVQVYDMQGKLYLHQRINYQSQWMRLPNLMDVLGFEVSANL